MLSLYHRILYLYVLVSVEFEHWAVGNEMCWVVGNGNCWNAENEENLFCRLVDSVGSRHCRKLQDWMDLRFFWLYHLVVDVPRK